MTPEERETFIKETARILCKSDGRIACAGCVDGCEAPTSYLIGEGYIDMAADVFAGQTQPAVQAERARCAGIARAHASIWCRAGNSIADAIERGELDADTAPDGFRRQQEKTTGETQMSGIIVEGEGQPLIKVRWDIDPSCVTLTQCGEEVSIPVDVIDEAIAAMRQQAKVHDSQTS